MFHSLLSHPEVTGLAYHRLSTIQQQVVKVVRRLVKAFFLVMKQNSLMVVESMFRFSDRSVKD